MFSVPVYALALTLTLTAHALGNLAEHPCEELLVITQFARAPNDQLGGRITEKVRLSLPSLIAAYRRGIFPWSVTADGYARWYNPPERGVLYFNKLHISTKDREFIEREMNRSVYQVTFDTAFTQVIRECRAMTRWRVDPRGQKVLDGEWISDEFVIKFTKLFEAGHAHSVEVWRDGTLVGGLYGTYVDGTFAGESMFHHESNVTKLALYSLLKRLESNGHTFIDTQVLGGLTEKWGAEKIPRASFLGQLEKNQERQLPF